MGNEPDNKNVTSIEGGAVPQAAGGVTEERHPRDDVAEGLDVPDVSLPKWYFFRHPLGFWFFFWGEFAERCSYYGMRAILALYMADKLGLGEANAATYNSFFIAACYFLPLVGGYVADRWFGKYWTIVGFSVPYILGHVVLGVEDFGFMVFALSLLAMGSGVIKPNISTLMGLTYDQQRPGQTKLRGDGFAMFYFSINVGAAISQFAMPYIRTHWGYQIAFLFPAALMVMAFAIFAAGKPFYAKETVGAKLPPKSPEERAAQWKVLSRILGLFVLVMFFWAVFDQASSTWIFFANSCMDLRMFGVEVDPDQIQAFNPVFILVLLPLITLGFKFLDRRGIKVRATDKMVVGFVLTAACMGVMALSAVLAGPADLRTTGVKGDLTVGPEGGDPVLAGDMKITLEDGKVTAKPADKKVQKSIVVEDARLVAQPGDKQVRIEGAKQTLVEGDGDAKEETKLPVSGPLVVGGKTKQWLFWTYDDISVTKRWFVDPANRVTVWWQVFAYLVITIAEVLISVTGLELAYAAAPKSMTGFVTACWLLTVGMANLLINAPVARVYTVMQPMAYFGMLGGTLLVVSVAFFFIAIQFNKVVKPAAVDDIPLPEYKDDALPAGGDGHTDVIEGEPDDRISGPGGVQDKP
jgi:solute carrier family 15 (oligopeptide transporter), member 1